MTGDGLLALMSRAYALTGATIPDSESYNKFKIFIEHYRRMKPDPAQIYPGVVELLTEYKKAGIKIGLCTNKQEEATHQFLGDLNLARFLIMSRVATRFRFTNRIRVMCWGCSMN